jgi:hypothetical protein
LFWLKKSRSNDYCSCCTRQTFNQARKNLCFWSPKFDLELLHALCCDNCPWWGRSKFVLNLPGCDLESDPPGRVPIMQGVAVVTDCRDKGNSMFGDQQHNSSEPLYLHDNILQNDHKEFYY